MIPYMDHFVYSFRAFVGSLQAIHETLSDLLNIGYKHLL